MVKNMSINLPEEAYEKIKTLSDFFNQDIEQTIISILDAIGKNGYWIKTLGKDKVPLEFESVLFHMLDASHHSIGLFDNILEKFDAKGLYIIADFDYNLDEYYYFFVYDSLKGNPLFIDSFHVAIFEPGELKRLTTHSLIDVKKNKERSLEKLKKIAVDIDICEKFDHLEDNTIEIEEDDEIWSLRIDLYAESLDYLPSIKQVSKLVKQIFKNSGIKYEEAPLINL